jgi:hypothetical protein
MNERSQDVKSTVSQRLGVGSNVFCRVNPEVCVASPSLSTATAYVVAKQLANGIEQLTL